MSHIRNSPEWRDPTATEAVNNVDNSHRKPAPITEHREVPPLSKFEDDTDWRGRRRLLRDLNKLIATTPKNEKATRKRLFAERAKLEAQQFISRVGADEAAAQMGLRRSNLHSKRR